MGRLIRGQDLFDYITKKRRLGEPEARHLMTQIIDTVTEMDAAGVVHRDIKDENVIVDVDNKQLRLVDFGSAALVQRRKPFSDFDVMYFSPWEKGSRQHGTNFTKVPNPI